MRRPERAPNQLRVEREEDFVFEAEEGSWAISYSDLLMVLMSFFVLFYQATPGKTKSLLEQLAVTVGGKPAVVAKPPSVKAPPAMPETLAAVLAAAHLPVDIETSRRSLVVHLPDNVYPPRGFRTTPEVERLLASLMDRLAPYAGQVDLYFVGHTDQQPLSHGNAYLSDNFDLSTLRATHALQFALAHGFPKDHLFAQGGAENLRDSRSLSIRIKPRGDTN